MLNIFCYKYFCFQIFVAIFHKKKYFLFLFVYTLYFINLNIFLQHFPTFSNISIAGNYQFFNHKHLQQFLSFTIFSTWNFRTLFFNFFLFSSKIFFIFIQLALLLQNFFFFSKAHLGFFGQNWIIDTHCHHQLLMKKRAFPSKTVRAAVMCYRFRSLRNLKFCSKSVFLWYCNAKAHEELNFTFSTWACHSW